MEYLTTMDWVLRLDPDAALSLAAYKHSTSCTLVSGHHRHDLQPSIRVLSYVHHSRYKLMATLTQPVPGQPSRQHPRGNLGLDFPVYLG